MYNLGKTYESMGKFEQGMHYLVQASRTDPRDPGIYLELGNCCFKDKKPQQAIAWYDKSISLVFRVCASSIGCGAGFLRQA